jgi:hypothetical protein
VEVSPDERGTNRWQAYDRRQQLDLPNDQDVSRRNQPIPPVNQDRFGGSATRGFAQLLAKHIVFISR